MSCHGVGMPSTLFSWVGVCERHIEVDSELNMASEQEKSSNGPVTVHVDPLLRCHRDRQPPSSGVTARRRHTLNFNLSKYFDVSRFGMVPNFRKSPQKKRAFPELQDFLMGNGISVTALPQWYREWGLKYGKRGYTHVHAQLAV